MTSQHNAPAALRATEVSDDGTTARTEGGLIVNTSTLQAAARQQAEKLSKAQRRKLERAAARAQAKAPVPPPQQQRDAEQGQDEGHGDEADDEQEFEASRIPPGFTWLLERGLVQPTNGRVFLRAILASDFTAIGGGGVDNIVDARQNAVAWEVVAIAPDVPKESGLEVGMWVHHLSTSANRIDKANASSRWFSIWYQDVEGMAWPPEYDEDMGEWQGFPVETVGQQVNIEAPYPWRAVAVSANAWDIEDGEGQRIGVRLKQATAEQIADQVNRRSSFHWVSSPQVATVPAAAMVRPEVERIIEQQAPVQDPQAEQLAQLNRVMQALNPEQQKTVSTVYAVNGLAAAVSVAEGFQRIGQMQVAPPAAERPGFEVGGQRVQVKAPPAPQGPAPAEAPDGAWGVFPQGYTQPIARFADQRAAERWVDHEQRTNPDARATRVEIAPVNQPPRWGQPVPMTMEQQLAWMAATKTHENGVTWGSPPGAASALAAAAAAGTTNPVVPAQQPSRSRWPGKL